MKTLLEVSSIKQIDKYVNKVDGFIMGYELFTSFSANYFSFEDIKKASTKALIYVNLNALMHNDDINNFKDVLLKLSSLNVHFIIQDLGASMLSKELKLINKTIFNSYTYITNSEDACAYAELGFEGVIASSEITLKDLCRINEKCPLIGAVTFGYHPMYQSYRHIIDLYKNENKLSFENKDLSIREWTRDFKAHVIDNKYGSIVFRPYLISLYKEYDCIDNLAFNIVNTIFLNDDQVDLIVDTIYKLKTKEIYGDEAELIIKDNFTVENGFMYSDSVYNPKEF